VGRWRGWADQGKRRGRWVVSFLVFLLFLFSFRYLNLVVGYINALQSSPINIYSLSLNGYTTTTIQRTIKSIGMLCNSQGLF
jgi:hypothetical protein